REEPLHALLVLRDARVDLAVGAFEIGVGDDAGATVAGAGDVNRVEVVLLDDPVEVDVNEVEAGRGPPVAEQPRLDVLLGQRLLQERVVVEVDLPHREIVRRAPVGVDLLELIRGQSLRGSTVARLTRLRLVGRRPCHCRAPYLPKLLGTPNSGRYLHCSPQVHRHIGQVHRPSRATGQTKASGSTCASPRAKRPMSSGPASMVTARPYASISAMSWPAIGPCMK